MYIVRGEIKELDKNSVTMSVQQASNKVSHTNECHVRELSAMGATPQTVML